MKNSGRFDFRLSFDLIIYRKKEESSRIGRSLEKSPTTSILKLAQFRQSLHDWMRKKYPDEKSAPESVYAIVDKVHDLSLSLGVDYGRTRIEREEWLKRFLSSYRSRPNSGERYPFVDA